MKAPMTPTHGEIDVIYENEEAETVDNAEEIEVENTQEILTATSKQMANQKAARGYYDVSNKGKGKKSSKDGKGKGRGEKYVNIPSEKYIYVQKYVYICVYTYLF